jgi:hypothetical protein
MGYGENPGPSVQPDFDILRSTRLYRPGTGNPDFSFSTGQWAPAIDRLLAAKYAFLPSRYSTEGYLFRGMQTGAKAGLSRRCFGHFKGDDELCMVEQAMGVFFLTHEISDAVTVSRLFDNAADGCILALKAETFNNHLDNYRAAVLGIGDGGIVFRYPFITESLAASSIDYLFVTTSFDKEEEIPVPPAAGMISLEGDTRRELETDLETRFDRLGIAPAIPVPGTLFPRSS